MVIHAHFDGKAFVPDQPVSLPVGQRVSIDIGPAAVITTGNGQFPLADLAAMIKDLPYDPATPSDLSEQHNDYACARTQKANP